MAKREITMIPATVPKYSAQSTSNGRQRRVAAYARVSTDNEEQLTSYEAQMDYYNKYIRERVDWSFAGMYSDEGISGTSTKNRHGFNRMITDAMAGKIDLIVTKSISRFARNTVDTLTTVRKLKEKGIEVFFEKENIYTLDSKGELLITIMSSIAQEESRSLSENVTWGQRKRMSDGKVSLPYKKFLGYERGPDGLPKVVESEAKVVRRIYRLLLEGKTPHGIATQLTEEGIPTPGGKTRWQSTSVESILTNEKYKGDALLQKKYTVDFLTKKQKKNQGEVPQYYVSGSHEAIVSPEVFDLVQQEMDRRKQLCGSYAAGGAFACRIICGECGGIFGPKLWHSNTKYRQFVWHCNRRYSSGKNEGTGCKTPHFSEKAIQDIFLEAFNSCITSRDEIIANCREALNMITDTQKLTSEMQTPESECEVASELIRKCVEENAHSTINQETFQEHYERLLAKYEASKTKLDLLNKKCSERNLQRNKIEAFLAELQERDALITEFSAGLWQLTVEKMTVYAKDKVILTFQDGSTYEWTGKK